MRVLVVGGHGFVGQATVAALREAGHRVIIADRSAGNSRSEFKVDLLNSGQRTSMVKKAKADALVHLAWQTSHNKFWSAPDNLDWVYASHDLLRCFFSSGGKRAVLAGSCAEYEWNMSNEPLTENARCHPKTLYGRCKLDLYRQCEEMINSGASIAWGRLFFLMGPGEHRARFIPYILQALLKNETARMGEGTKVRDFLHVYDAGRAFAALVDNPISGAVNIASGVGVTLADIAVAAHEKIGTGDLIVGTHPSSTKEPPSLVADVRRLREEVGFEWRFTWLSALDACIEYWQKEINSHSGGKISQP